MMSIDDTTKVKIWQDMYKQAAWERDVAIKQLEQLGYELGEKIEPDQFRDPTKKTDFQPGNKFILELGAEIRMFGEFEIKGTDLYVKTDLLEKLTRYEPEEKLDSAQPEPVTDCHGLTGDLISRQKAINAFHYYFRDGFEEDKWWNSTHVLAAIEGLPSEQSELKWETCFDCPLSHGCPKIKGCTNEQAIEYASQIPNDCPLSTQPEIIHCNSCKHWTQSTGKMKGYGLGRCDFHDADLVTCNGFCYWAERRNDG